MTQIRRVSGVATSIRQEDGYTKVRYHNTDVVCFNDKHIILDSGGWQTATTKTRMNQASNQFNLGFHVYQEKGEWYVSYPHHKERGCIHIKCMGFSDRMKLDRSKIIGWDDVEIGSTMITELPPQKQLEPSSSGEPT